MTSLRSPFIICSKLAVLTIYSLSIAISIVYFFWCLLNKHSIYWIETLIISLNSFALTSNKLSYCLGFLLVMSAAVSTEIALAETKSAKTTIIPRSLVLCQEATLSEQLSKNEVKGPAPLSDEDQKSLNEGGMLLHAKDVNYIPDEKLELLGEVELQNSLYHAYSDQASIDHTSQQAQLSGNIVLGSADLTLQGSSATMNSKTNEVLIENAKFINNQTGVNGEAKALSHPDESTLIIHDGLFSSCPPEKRDWAFASSKITLNRDEGFGQAKHTRFLIKDTPVFYIPWFSFPIDDRRKSGFLYPTVGSSNTESGIVVSTPYYLNLAENYDATITPAYIGGRGIHYDVEGRHKNQYTESVLMLGYIDEDDYYASEQTLLNSSNDPERWGFSFEQEIYPFADGWTGQLNFSEVSDNDYLEDLNQGLSIDRTDNLDRRAEFSYDQEDWRFSFLLQEYKSIDDQVLPNEQAYQRLPELYFEMGQVYNRLQLDWTSRYVYFYRECLIHKRKS